MTDLSPKFDAKAAEPQLLTPSAYKQLLEQLLTQGTGFGKTKPVAAYKTQDIKIATLQSDGTGETEKKITVQPAYITLDVDQYPDTENDRLRKAVVRKTAQNWGEKVVHERELNTPDFKASGVWVSDEGKVGVKGFLFDYVSAEPNNPKCVLFNPNPEATRVCLELTQPVKIPVVWDGGFQIKTNGAFAVRERDVADLIAALKDINTGKATIEEALYSAPGVAKFDVYGMEPNFLGNNYGGVTLKAETASAVTSLTTKAGKPNGNKLG